MNSIERLLWAGFIMISLFACESKPKIIVADAGEATPSQPNQEMPSGAASPAEGGDAGVHQVVAKEILQAERYTYLNVLEGTHNYWIATAKKEAKKGNTYFYKGGLMKTNFESQEFKRTFDTIYLVASIIDASEHPGGDVNASPGADIPAVSSAPPATVVKDAIKLSDLMANKAKYDGKFITVSGQCVKVNNGIMGRNWVHIQDGSKEKGKIINLTVTTQINVPVGSNVALKGKVALNKDFGAGYRYDIILEDQGGMTQ